MVAFLKELVLDLSITIAFCACVHFGLRAADVDEVKLVEDSIGWVIDTLGVYHVPDYQQGRYLN